MNAFVEVGCLVICPKNTDWGVGQVQSVVGNRVTVNFQHAGKLVIDTEFVELEYYYE